MTRTSPDLGAEPVSSDVDKLISVIVPVFNEFEVIAEFHRRTSDVLSRLPGLVYEIIYVDDGSSDGSHDQLVAFATNDPRVRVIKFSRNFGHQNAITAGLDFSRGDCVVLIDADLQDPPEVIGPMVEKWRERYDVVYGQRTLREGETRVKLFTASLFYRVLRRVTNVDIPSDVGDFRLLSRRAAHQLKTMREKDRFVRGMVSWIGFRQTGVEYRRDVRLAGETKYPFGKMTRFALDGVTSFSTAPLRMATWFGYAAVRARLPLRTVGPHTIRVGYNRARFLDDHGRAPLPGWDPTDLHRDSWGVHRQDLQRGQGTTAVHCREGLRLKRCVCHGRPGITRFSLIAPL